MAFQATGVAVGGAATQVYFPAAVGSPNAVITNTSGNTIYVGGSTVTVATGLQLFPNQTLDLQSYPTGIYAIAAPGTLGTASTLSAAGTASALTLAVTATTGFGTSTILQVGTGNAAETLTVASTTGTTITFTTGARWAHASGEAIALVSAPKGGSLTVLAGTS
jgi:hypothetical protein